MIKKTHIVVPKILTNSCHILRFGSYGFRILFSLRLNKNQLTSLERALLKKLKQLSNYSKSFKLWTLINFNRTLTKLSLESRMGKGKGNIYTEALFLKRGSIIYEFQNMTDQQIKEVFDFFKKQFPIKIALVNKK